eukprot:PhF_6_TR42887/c0_g1_i2/m.64978
MSLFTSRTCSTLAECHTGDGGMHFNSQYNSLITAPVLIGAHIFYIVLVIGLRAFMKNREEMKCTTAKLVYNSIQVVLSVLIAGALFPNFIQQPNILNTPFCSDIEFWVFVHYLSKYVDWFDSIFIVLGKKDRQLSVLHLYHHLTIGLIWGFLLRAGLGNGTAFYGAFINSFVHAVMYFHYLITSFGIKNPYKHYITTLQMTQFASCILHAVLVLLTPFPKSWALFQLCYHCTLLVLFGNFYKQTFGKKGGAGGD